MDIDAFTAVHRDEWARLDALSAKRRLSGDEADELLVLYQRISTHLSMIRSVAPEGQLSAALSARLSRARTRFTGAKSSFAEDVAGFFVRSLPAAFYRLRWLTVAVGAAFILIAWLYGAWVAGNPEVIKALGSDADLRRYVEEDFVNYYTENPHASFAGMVWTNNAWIAAQCVAFGVTGLWVPYTVYLNAQGVGIAGGMMAAYDRLDTFFLYILPHGLMELTAIFIAAAAGLRIFWSWVSPGPRTRLASMAVEGRSLVTVALGLVLVLFLSGLVEGFVTPSGLPHWLRISLGALLLAAYWVYTLVLGKRAFDAGARGDLDRFDAGAEARTA
ncbi:stage II sporulation protein M [Arthrobacter sp. I2-34]|uniref:Stage II sporulation protein M n=1 Tax=Arthrobacter hankyongi TaxID=2904801 RepID=A0ABS9L1M1_9MICC|nr:stage II sporulation protein M [Arthrobacter hankyongi]MCG2620584.1 stage II sporulation protein M [Arthrobacter hankyongi]